MIWNFVYKFDTLIVDFVQKSNKNIKTGNSFVIRIFESMRIFIAHYLFPTKSEASKSKIHTHTIHITGYDVYISVESENIINVRDSKRLSFLLIHPYESNTLGTSNRSNSIILEFSSLLRNCLRSVKSEYQIISIVVVASVQRPLYPSLLIWF